jgi:hypothetical protein
LKISRSIGIFALSGSVAVAALGGSLWLSRPARIKDGLSKDDVRGIQRALSHERWVFIQDALARRQFRVSGSGPYLIELAFARVREIGPISGLQSNGQPVPGAYALVDGPFSHSTALFFLAHKSGVWETGEPGSQYRRRK